MSNLNKQQEQRRKVIAMLGASAVAVPVLGLSACGGDSSSDAGASAQKAADSMQNAMDNAQDAAADATESMADKAQSTMDSARDSVEDAMSDAESAVDDAMDSAESAADDAMDQAEVIAKDTAAGMAQVDENGPQASGLGYRHDATTVDASVQTRYAAGQQCSNCVLFQGGDAEWGGCPLFAGQQVKSTGWCSAYAAAG